MQSPIPLKLTKIRIWRFLIMNLVIIPNDIFTATSNHATHSHPDLPEPLSG
ncbi:hypothetical protein Hanom_Chr02g00115781 [Helianthus anomalus]